ncbi:MAG: hypothetical protein FD134_371 [Gallionellaceae bacterium]|nr:MAG: hypothetical protein FD134_371 [Gallionellaceae bacterium]
MNDWTPVSILFWLAVAIVVPGIVVHFTLGRKGGHHLFDKDNLSPDQIRNLPFEMVRKRTIWNLKGSAATMVGLALAMALYPFGCLIGLPINVFGISDQKLVYYATGSVVLALTLGPAIYRKFYEKSDGSDGD